MDNKIVSISEPICETYLPVGRFVEFVDNTNVSTGGLIYAIRVIRG